MSLPGDIFDGKAACSKVDPAHSCLQSVKGNELCVLARFELSLQDPRAAHGFSSLVLLASTRAAHHFKWPKLGPCQVVGFQSFFLAALRGSLGVLCVGQVQDVSSRGNFKIRQNIYPPPPRENITKIIRTKYFCVISGGAYGKIA